MYDLSVCPGDTRVVLFQLWEVKDDGMSGRDHGVEGDYFLMECADLEGKRCCAVRDCPSPD